MRRRVPIASVFVFVLCSSAPCVFGGMLVPVPEGDGYVNHDWFSGHHDFVDNTSPTISVTHRGDSGDRWLNRGLVIIDISSLAGTTLPVNGAAFNFYSNGFSNVNLQYSGAVSTPVVTTAYHTLSGADIATLDATAGWLSYDVTADVQSGIDAGHQYAGFVFNATLNNGGGSLAASEDPAGHGAFLNVIPEPATFSLLVVGGLALMKRRRR